MKQVTINEERLRSIIRETLNGIMETMVNKFTPYSEEDRKRNFSPFFGGDNRSPEERNPSYAKAKRDAEERMRKRKMENGCK
jgi:hypothetical protein